MLISIPLYSPRIKYIYRVTYIDFLPEGLKCTWLTPNGMKAALTDVIEDILFFKSVVQSDVPCHMSYEDVMRVEMFWGIANLRSIYFFKDPTARGSNVYYVASPASLIEFFDNEPDVKIIYPK